MPLTKAVIYTRFSPRPAEQMDNCVSPQVQEQACREYAKKMGYRVIGVFGDEGVSRNTEVREGLIDCIAAVRKGTVVLVSHPDRLGATVPAAIAEGKINGRGGRVEYTTESLNGDDHISELMRKIMHAIADFERGEIGRRTSRGMKRRQSSGQVMTRRDKLPYGYRIDPDDDTKMIEDADEQRVIERVLELRYEHDLGYRRIAGKLANEGTMARNGKPMSHAMIGNIIRANAQDQ